MRIVVLEPDEAQDRRPDVGMIAEDLAEPAFAEYAGTDHAEPGMGDLVLEIAMVPRKAGIFDESSSLRSASACTAAAVCLPKSLKK